MANYLVTWEVHVEDAANPLEAARRARGYQTKPDTTATVFEVAELDAHRRPVSAVEVDLGGPGEPGHVNGEPLPEPHCNHDLTARTVLPLSDYDQCECGLLFYDGEPVREAGLGRSVPRPSDPRRSRHFAVDSVRRGIVDRMARSREVTRGTPEGAVDAEIGQLRGNPDGGPSFAPTVWVVNCTEEVDGLYVFLEEDQAWEHAGRYGDNATVSEEIVMNGSAGAQFLIDTGDSEHDD